MKNDGLVLEKLSHKYSEEELIKILIYIAKDNNEDGRFDAIIDAPKQAKVRVSELINHLMKTWNTKRFVGNLQQTDPYTRYKFSRLETLIIIYIFLFGKGKGSLYSKTKQNTKANITYKDFEDFYNGLHDFLLNEKLKRDGKWYNYEKNFLKQLDLSEQDRQKFRLIINDDFQESIDVLDESDIEYGLEALQRFSLILYKKEMIEKECINHIEQRFDSLISNETMNYIPVFDFFEKSTYNGKEYGEITDELTLLKDNLIESIDKQFDITDKKINTKTT